MLSQYRARSFLTSAVLMLSLVKPANAQSSGNRLLGLDISTWQGNISQTTWNNFRTVEDRRFVFLRASRGGTTGVDHLRGGYPSNDNTFFSLSQRYDDPYFIQNINRATNAGMYAGSYHFSRPDIIATTPNAAGIANTGIDEANHFIQMAGAFMRPGYLPPVHDLEAGDGLRTDIEIAQFTLDFSDRIYQVMGIRPALYTNGNYAQNVLGGGTATQRSLLAQQSPTAPNPAGPAYSQLWIARWPNQANPNAIAVQTAHPKDSVSTVYGPFDDYGVTHPWVFWQYASTGRLNSFNGGTSNLDFNVVQGGEEYLKDQLIPAVWINDNSGDWSTLLNWNSGQPAIVPIVSPGQLTPAPGTLPIPRLPGAAGTGPTAGSNDTVILDRPTANITVTLSTGVHNIRKLYVREMLNITAGSLTVNYVPVPESTPMSAKFSSPVSISGFASLTVHTLHLDPTTDFTAGNAFLTFDTLMLARGSTPARLVMNGGVTFTGLSGVTATIETNSGPANIGLVDLSGGTRSFNVINGAAASDLEISIPVVNGGLIKTGAGTMILSGINTFSGSTAVNSGILTVNGVNSGNGAVAVDTGGTLSGIGQIAGAVTVNSTGTIRGGSTLGTLTLGSGLTVGPGGSIYTKIADGTTPGTISTGNSTLGTLPNPTSNNFLYITGGTSSVSPSATIIVDLSGVTFTSLGNSRSYSIADGAGNQSALNITNPAQFTFIGFSGIISSPSLTGNSTGEIFLNFTPSVPEPALLALIGLGLAGLRTRLRARARVL